MTHRADRAHSDRFRAVASHPLIASQPGLRSLALQAAERAPADMTAGQIVVETIERFWSNTDREALGRASAAKWAPRAEGAADPLAAADQTGKPVADCGWSKLIAAQHAGDGAVASGGPFEPHPSSLGGDL